MRVVKLDTKAENCRIARRQVELNEKNKEKILCVVGGWLALVYTLQDIKNIILSFPDSVITKIVQADDREKADIFIKHIILPPSVAGIKDWSKDETVEIVREAIKELKDEEVVMIAMEFIQEMKKEEN